MILQIARLALRVAISGRSGQRARAALVVAAVALFTAAIWGIAGFWSASQHNEARDTARSPVMRFSDGDGVPVVGDSLPILRGRQFQIMWFAPAPQGPDEFGRRLPAPGHAFVSPSLLSAAGGADGFERRFGITVDGHSTDVEWDRILAFGDEYLAFAMLPEGRQLKARSWLLGFDPAGHSAPEAVTPASAAEFQLPDGPVAVPFWIDERVPPSTQALTAGLFLLGVPALVALTIGVASRSQLRAERRSALVYLGASRTALGWFDAVETAILSLPTVFATSAVCWIALSRMTRLPAGTVAFRAGDLRPTAFAISITMSMSAIVPIIVGAAAPRVSAWRSSRRKRIVRWASPALALVPVMVSFVAPILTEARAIPFFAVTLAVLGVLPWVSTGLLPPLGTLLGGPRVISRFVAGRRLQWGDLRASTLMRVTILAVVVVVVVSAMNLAGAMPSKTSGLPRGIVTLSAPGGLTTEDSSLVIESVPDLPIAITTPGQVFVADCSILAHLILVKTEMCTTNPTHVTSLASGSQLGQLGAIVFGSPESGTTVTQLIARVGSDSNNLALQSAANHLFGPSQVLGWDQLGANPMTGWLSSLGLAAVLLLATGLALLLLNVVRFPSPSDLALSQLAASEQTRAGILRWEFHVVVLVGALLGAGYALLINSAGQPDQITRVEQWPLATAALASAAAISTIVELGIHVAKRSTKPTASMPNPATDNVREFEATT